MYLVISLFWLSVFFMLKGFGYLFKMSIEKLSTIIIFKLCKFSRNLWTLCFFSYKRYRPFKMDVVRWKLSKAAGLAFYQSFVIANNFKSDYQTCTFPLCTTLKPLWWTSLHTMCNNHIMASKFKNASRKTFMNLK